MYKVAVFQLFEKCPAKRHNLLCDSMLGAGHFCLVCWPEWPRSGTDLTPAYGHPSRAPSASPQGGGELLRIPSTASESFPYS